MRAGIEAIFSGAGHIHPAESIEALRLAVGKISVGRFFRQPL
jgi:hypothetical protein